MIIRYIYELKSIACNCSDKTPYPEKFIFSVLEQLGLNFKPQLNKSIFKWCGTFRYDFYFKFNNKKHIIESHGKQHYEENNRGRYLEEEKKNDMLKKELALQNEIYEENYIVIDCRYSKLEFIKKSILESRLNELFDLSKIDWNKAQEYACSNLIKIASEYKKKDPNLSVNEIAKTMNLSTSTIREYLKKGNELNWCIYNPNDEREKGFIKISNRNKKLNSKPVEIFKGEFTSAVELEKKSLKSFGVKLDQRHIRDVCNGRRKTHKGFTFKDIKEDKKYIT